MNDQPPRVTTNAASVIACVFAVVIGVLFMVMLWTVFVRAPLLFRLIGTAIAGFFILCGFMATGVMRRDAADIESRAIEVVYECPNCGAAIDRELKVSPHGDALCMYCNSWFNINSRSE